RGGQRGGGGEWRDTRPHRESGLRRRATGQEGVAALEVADQAERRPVQRERRAVTGLPAHSEPIERVAPDLYHAHLHVDHPLEAAAAHEVERLRITLEDLLAAQCVLLGWTASV